MNLNETNRDTQDGQDRNVPSCESCASLFGAVENKREAGVKLRFPEGLPALELHREFECRPDSDFPSFLWLRSLSPVRRGSTELAEVRTGGDDEPLQLLTVSPFSVVADYAPEVRDSDAEQMGIEEPEDAMLLSILNFSRYPEEIAVNLAGPILVNRKTMQARQVVLENASEYEVHHRLVLAAPVSAARVEPDVPAAGR